MRYFLSAVLACLSVRALAASASGGGAAGGPFLPLTGGSLTGPVAIDTDTSGGSPFRVADAAYHSAGYTTFGDVMQPADDSFSLVDTEGTTGAYYYGRLFMGSNNNPVSFGANIRGGVRGAQTPTPQGALATFSFSGFNGMGNPGVTGSMDISASETWSPGNHGTQLGWRITPRTTGATQTVLGLDENGLAYFAAGSPNPSTLIGISTGNSPGDVSSMPIYLMAPNGGNNGMIGSSVGDGTMSLAFQGGGGGQVGLGGNAIGIVSGDGGINIVTSTNGAVVVHGGAGGVSLDDFGVGGPVNIQSANSVNLQATGGGITITGGMAGVTINNTQGGGVNISGDTGGAIQITSNANDLTLEAAGGTLKLENGNNQLYYCSGGAMSGNLCRGNGCTCTAGTWIGTSISIP